MSTPAVSPAGSDVIEKRTTTRRIPASQADAGRQTPEFWEFLESMTDDMWASDYMLYILREDPKPSNYGGTNTIDKCPGYIEMPGGSRVRLDSREDVELAIKQKFGGKAYRLILKKGRERITEGKCVNEAPPKYPETNPQSQFSGPLPHASATSDANAIASKAIDTVANQPQEAMNIALNALRASAEIIARSANPGTPTPSADSDLDRAFKQAMIAKLLAPPPDPLETFVRLKDLLQPAAANGVKETLELVGALRNSGLFPTGGGKSSLLDLGREALPVLAQTVDRAMTQWRMGVEAQRDSIALQRGMNPGAPMPAADMSQPTLPAPPPPPDAPPPGQAAATNPQPAADNNPPFEWLEMKIVEILKDKDFTVDQAVDEMLAFLYRAHPAVVGLLLDPPKLDPRLSPGEQGILQLFQNRPILQQVQVGPRLTEFIKKFIAAAKDAESQRLGAAPQPEPPPSA